MTDTRSTACNRKPCGQNVLRSIVVSIMACAAAGTLPTANAKIETIEHRPALAACLRAGEESINLDQTPPVPTALVFKLPNKLAPSCIADRPGQRPVLDHSTDVQVFHHDHLVFANEAGAELVEVVSSPVGDTGMQAAELRSGFFPVLRSFLLPGESARQETFSFHLGGIVPGVGDFLSGGESCKVSQTEVDADCGFRRLEWLDAVVFAQHRDVPPAGCIEVDRDCGGCGPFGKRPGPSDIQRNVHLRNPQLAFLQTESAPGELGRAPASSSLETRVPGSFAEEVPVGDLEVPESLLKGDARNFVEERQVVGLLPSGQASALLGIRQRDFTRDPRFRPLSERLVVHEPTAPYSPTEQNLLLGGRVKAVSEGPQHCLHGTLRISKRKKGAR